MINVAAIPRSRPRQPFYKTLYFRVLVGILIGIVLGAFYPSVGESMRPLGDGFIKLIRMMIAPIIFCTVVVGIAGMGDMGKLGRVGLKALLYFEVMTSLALIVGLVVVTVAKPGAGINADPSTLDAKAVQQYAKQGQSMHAVDFLLNIIPDTLVSAFDKGDLLQVLLISILAGLALAKIDQRHTVLHGIESVSRVLFGIIPIIMEAAPIGAFGAMAFTIGKYGIRTLLPLGKLLLCVYLTCGLFVFLGLGLVTYLHGFSIWKLIKYIKEELLIVLATSSSEAALPRLITKLEKLGCSKSVVGLVVPSGYSFNLDGTSIYLTIAAVFVAQATNTQMTMGQEWTLLLILMLTSKGAAGVTGSGFITLAATLTVVGTIPIAGLTLLLGVDRFMSEMRAITNIIGNAVATVVVAKWENELDQNRMARVLNGEPEVDAAEPVLTEV